MIKNTASAEPAGSEAGHSKSPPSLDGRYVLWFSEVSREDGNLVGGKNASLGEMISNLQSAGIRVPDGFAVTAAAYRDFVEENALNARISRELVRFEEEPDKLSDIGHNIRTMIISAEFSDDLKSGIRSAYRQMDDQQNELISVAVRSSATAEDLPEASFAGQLETFLNISGDDALLDACKKCFASLFTDRAISYRKNHGFGQIDIAISVGVQRMVRSDKASSGVMFTLDTETGFPGVVLINGAWGLGETVVQGSVDPDEFEISKVSLAAGATNPVIRKSCGAKAQKLIYAEKSSDSAPNPTILIDASPAERSSFVLGTDELTTLARWAVMIETHYGQAMDMEWAKDGETSDLYIVQARPETVQSRKAAGQLRSFRLKEKSEPVLEGVAIGDAIASGRVCLIKSADNIADFKEGSVLVTAMTDPDWVPIMKKAAAIVTDHGGRTSHAAIVSRELGLPAIIGAGHATSTLHEEQEITVSCAQGETGIVYEGVLDFEIRDIDLTQIPDTQTKIMLNLANPSAAYRWWKLPCSGVGLARTEFIIGNLIKIHPMALAQFNDVEDQQARDKIEELTVGYADKEEYFVDKLSQGIARIAAGFHPHPVIVRMSDFKTNEYAGLIGGGQFEPHEDNPMLGWRGASRYYDERYRAGFALECKAMRRVRTDMGLTNVKLMVPFCRTIEEADKVLGELRANGLRKGENGLDIYVMAEIPSNILLAEQFAERFYGFSIGSNDLTQLTLGIDRDSERLQPLFDERNEAVKTIIADLLKKSAKTATPVGICGEAPSNYPEFAQFLVANGVDSISVSPDSFLNVKTAVAAAEEEMALAATRK